MAESRKAFETSGERVRRLSCVVVLPLSHRELARVLFERAQDGYVNPTGGKTTGRERREP